MTPQTPSLSVSQRTTWLDCRLRWHYEYVSKPDVPKYLNRDLMRGAAGHAALEAYYAVQPEGRSLAMLLSNAEQYLLELGQSVDMNEGEQQDIVKAAREVASALKGFWGTFGSDIDYPDVKTEIRLSRHLTTLKNENGEANWEFHGVLDGVVDLPDRTIIIENKFPLYVPRAGQYELWSPQHRDYAWLLGVDKPVFVVYNVVSTNQAVRYGPILIPVWQQDDAAQVSIAVAKEITNANGIVYPNYGNRCMSCPYQRLCIDWLIGGEIG